MIAHRTKVGRHDNPSFGWWWTCRCGCQEFDIVSHGDAELAAVRHVLSSKALDDFEAQSVINALAAKNLAAPAGDA